MAGLIYGSLQSCNRTTTEVRRQPHTQKETSVLNINILLQVNDYEYMTFLFKFLTFIPLQRHKFTNTKYALCFPTLSKKIASKVTER